MRPTVPVACGVLRNEAGLVLIAQRPVGRIAAGKWEFPGGKIEMGETAAEALERELLEELGIKVTEARPLICVTHDYSDRRVVLDTWIISAWSGEILARENQAFAWVHPSELGQYDLLAADGPIVASLLLPQHYAFSPPAASREQILHGLRLLPAAALVRLRLPSLNTSDYEALAEELLPVARDHGLRLLLDREADMVRRTRADGWHVTAANLESLGQRPDGIGLVAASCHNEHELRLAQRLQADIVVLGPVQHTRSHPGAKALTWPGFALLARNANLPAYAIGGLGPADMNLAHRHYAQGIAGISAFWR